MPNANASLAGTDKTRPQALPVKALQDHWQATGEGWNDFGPVGGSRNRHLDSRLTRRPTPR